MQRPASNQRLVAPRNTAHPRSAIPPVTLPPRRGNSLTLRDALQLLVLAVAGVVVTMLWLVPMLEGLSEARAHEHRHPELSELCGRKVELSNGLTALIECDGDGPKSEVGP
jgi:hypothetical protein